MPAAKEKNVIYMTDVEGNWEYFCRLVDLSDGIGFVEGCGKDSATPELELVSFW